jgi:hypothetical protein
LALSGGADRTIRAKSMHGSQDPKVAILDRPSPEISSR